MLYLHGEAGGGVGAGFLTVDTFPALRASRGDGMVQVVVQELSPLHHHVRDFSVRGDVVRTDDGRGDETGARQ